MRPTINLRMPESIVVFLNGNIVRLDPLTGQIMWETSIPSGFGYRFGTIAIDGDLVLVGSNGHVHALDIEDGRLIWSNPMKGMGYGLVTIASSNGQGAVNAAQQAAHQAASAAALAATAAAASAASS